MTKFKKGDKVTLTGVVAQSVNAEMVRVLVAGVTDALWIDEKFLTPIPKTPEDAIIGEVWKVNGQFFRRVKPLGLAQSLVWVNVNVSQESLYNSDRDMAGAEYVGTVPGSEAWKRDNND